MKKLLHLVCIILISVTANAQTYLINGALGNGDFEAAAGLPTTSTWTTANQSTNYWEVGTKTSRTGTKCAYIRNSSTNNTYTTGTAQRSYIHTNPTYTIPAGANCAFLSFWYKGNGQTNFDYLRAFLTSALPTAGSNPPAGATQLGGDYNMVGTTWTQVTVAIPPALFGTAQRVMFYWRNDNSGGTQDPAAVDDVQLYYNTTGPANDDCAGAISMPVGAFGTCTTTAGDITCNSNSGVAATLGTADDDMWYSFVATSANHTVNLSTAMSAVIDVFSGTCGALVPHANANANTLALSGLTIGNTYYVRVYSFSATKPTPGTFTICVTTPPVCPSGIGTGNVTIGTLPYNITGQTTCGMVNNITAASVNNMCGSSAYYEGEDVVYNFTPTTSGNISITLTSTGTKTALMLYEGCPFTGACINFSQSSTGNKALSCISVTAGVTYYLIVGSDPNPTCNPYDLSITAPAAPVWANDDACGATVVPIGAATCTYTTYDLTGACSSPVPAPSCGTYSGQDVWFSFVVPTTGTYEIDTKQGTMTDAFMAIYRGTTCGGALTQIACDNDASVNGLMPFISTNSLIVGETIYIRIMPNGAAAPGTFQLCVNNLCPGGLAANDNPCNATLIPIGGAAYGDNTCSSNGVGTTEPPIGGGISGVAGTYNSIWYRFVAPPSGAVNIRTVLGSLRNTIMAVYSGTCGTGLTLVADNDDIALCAVGGSNLNSELKLTGLTNATTYYIAVDGINNSLGDFSIGVILGTNTWPLVRGSDCGAAKDVCDDSTSTSNPGFQAFGNYCDLGGGTCLSDGEKSSVWFNIPIIAPGTLAFDIVANDYGTPTNPFTGQSNPGYFSAGDETDYDFAIWKVTGTVASTCAAIAAATPLAPVGCSYSGLGVTGLNGTSNNVAPAPYSPGFDFAYQQQLNVLAGEKYLLLVNNFSNSTAGFTLNLKGTTAIAGVDYSVGITGTILTWTGGNSTTKWDNVDNWGGCAVPSCTKDVIIDPLFIQPTITAAMGVVSCRDLLVNVGATLTMAAGSTIRVCGNINILGSIVCDPTSTIWFNDENITHTINGNLTGTDALGNLTIQDPIASVGVNCRVQTLVDIDLKGSFTTVNATSIFDLNSKYIKIGRNFMNFQNNVTFTNCNSAPATVEFNGSTTQTFSVGIGTMGFHNVTLNQSAASNVNFTTGKLILSPTGILSLVQGKLTFSTPATQEVYLQNNTPGAVNAGNVTSYVEGQLRRSFTPTSIGSYDFPVGNASKGYELLNINFTAATGAASNFTLATVFNDWGGAFPFPSPLGVTECTQVFNNPWLDNGNWSVDEYDAAIVLANKGAIAVPGLYNLTLYNRSYTNGATSLGWTIAKSPSASPVWGIQPGSICQATPITAERRNNFSGFSRFGTIQSAAVLLPIELTTFEANAELTYNAIQWITATETNNDYFEVEACDDGINFKAIEKIKGAGNSNATLHYQTRDKNYSPTTYYRLKQVDFDGKFTYSEMRVVSRFNKNTKDAFTIDVAPNPTDNQVTVAVTNGVKETYTVVVYSVEGKLLMKTEIQEKDFSKGTTLDLSALENGLYNVEVYSTKGTVVKKIIKFN